jgi:hypothetical protein
MTYTRSQPSRRCAALAGLAIILLSPALAVAATGAPTAAQGDSADRYRAWVAQMKDNPRGPFAAVKWFCKDGSVLPPRPGACSGRGGGVQHGEYSDRTRELRARGYKVATFLDGLDAAAAVAAPEFPNTFAQLLVEKFLIAADGGWIFRQAQFYRGAIQAEGERDGARQLLVAMAARPEWIGYRYPALRSGARLLPHGSDTPSAQQVRQSAAALADAMRDSPRCGPRSTTRRMPAMPPGCAHTRAPGGEGPGGALRGPGRRHRSILPTAPARRPARRGREGARGRSEAPGPARRVGPRVREGRGRGQPVHRHGAAARRHRVAGRAAHALLHGGPRLERPQEELGRGAPSTGRADPSADRRRPLVARATGDAGSGPALVLPPGPFDRGRWGQSSQRGLLRTRAGLARPVGR